MLRRLLDSPRTYFAAAGLLLLGGVLSMFELNLPSREVGGLRELDALHGRDDLNVVFVLIDTLRADRLGAYGHERDTSPVMDALAASGVRFAHVQAQSSWTKASMASLWTGLYPRRTGVTRYDHGVPAEALLPAEILRDAGFRTAGIFRNGWLDTNFGFSQGFELYVQPRPSATPARFQRHNPSAAALAGSDVDATHSAREFIRGHAHERFFLYVHYMDVHQYLYDEESGLFGTHIRDVYDNAIHWTDRNVSALLAELDEHDLMERTLVVVASDHGEAFYEHGIEGHARNLYREVTETPLLLFLPFRLEPGVVVEETVENVDVWPTILDLLGLAPLPDPDGRSLVPLIRRALGASDPLPEGLADGATFAELDRTWGRHERDPEPIVAMVDEPYRLIRHLDAPDRAELYDRSGDRLEQRNLAVHRLDVLKELSRRVDAYSENHPPWDEVPSVELDALRLSQLRALGYIDLNVPKDEEEPEGAGGPDGGGPTASDAP